MAEFKNSQIPQENAQGLNDRQKLEIQELIAAALANWTGITRFRTIESVVTTITDFTSAQHNHSNAAGGGKFNPNNAFTTPVTVPNGGTGVNTLTNNAILIGQAAGAVSSIVGKSGTFSFYVAATSGGAVTTKVDCDRGVITAVT